MYRDSLKVFVLFCSFLSIKLRTKENRVEEYRQSNWRRVLEISLRLGLMLREQKA